MTPQTVAQPATAAPSPAAPLLEVSGALLGIILLILAAGWLARRVGVGGGRRAGQQGLKVSASAALGQRERVVIVDVDDARLVLGVTAQQVTLLHTLPPSPAAPQAARPEAADFASLMKTILKRPERS
ncbi:flagellar biosynthetic protein FliO [uncultured Pluralibacter sp.]|uniref:flagellar biosynthetic protein FliO n=1 Tax=uncultured Pluralibacter sp. TaxID=1490864 RepID=UPI00262F735B|nr:flagellar biosynthetic protein FliO [uncultured Pluralibacter sp.]